MSERGRGVNRLVEVCSKREMGEGARKVAHWLREPLAEGEIGEGGRK